MNWTGNGVSGIVELNEVDKEGSVMSLPGLLLRKTFQHWNHTFLYLKQWSLWEWHYEMNWEEETLRTFEKSLWSWREQRKQASWLVNMRVALPIVGFGGSALKVTGGRTMPKVNRRNVMKITITKSNYFSSRYSYL